MGLTDEEIEDIDEIFSFYGWEKRDNLYYLNEQVRWYAFYVDLYAAESVEQAADIMDKEADSIDISKEVKDLTDEDLHGCCNGAPYELDKLIIGIMEVRQNIRYVAEDIRNLYEE